MRIADRRAAALVLAGVALVAQQGPAAEPARLVHDAYIWQRRWTPALAEAVLQSAQHVRRWRVLGAEVSGSGEFLEFRPSPEPLRKAGPQIVVVVRINGQIARWSHDQIATRTVALARRWHDDGLPVAGVEIDHDCGSARLREYALFLDRLQAARAGGLTLSITALPSWMESGRLGDLLTRVDEAVLQVHSVADPERGLFEPAAAYDWTRRWSRVGAVPFRVALPTYGSRVTRNDEGRVTSVESEAPSLSNLAAGRELSVRPLDVDRFVRQLRHARIGGLAGIAWFRLPTRDDRRAWSLSTWHALVNGTARAPRMTTRVMGSDVLGTSNVYISNEGPIDDWLPPHVRVTAESECEAADAVSPYMVSRPGGGVVLRLASPRLIAAGDMQLVGWVRCSPVAGRIYASF
jgi:hypothetical protein